MTIELSGKTARGATIRMLRVGVWHADVVVAEETPVTGRVTLVVDGESFVGTYLRGQAFSGQTPVRIVGGGGTLSRSLEAKNYASGPTVRQVVSDILGSDETLSSEADSGVLDSQLPNYHRIQGLASHALTVVLNKIGATWRVLSDGTVWIGHDTYPVQTLDHVVDDEDWFAGIITIAPEAPSLRPGVTFLGHRIEEVVHYAAPESLRTEARLTSAASSLGAFLGLIRREIDYAKRYPARVVKANGDGTAQVIPDDANVKASGLDRVRVRSGMPGTITPKKGARCLLGWDAADPSRPYIEGWDDETVEEMALADGFSPGARVGSTVNVFFPPVAPVSGVLNGQAFVGTVAFVSPGIGVIQDGNPKVKL